MHFKYFIQHINFLQPKYVGPFQVISLNALQYVEELLSQLNMEKEDKREHDPHKIIYKYRVSNKNSPYECIPRLDLESIA